MADPSGPESGGSKPPAVLAFDLHFPPKAWIGAVQRAFPAAQTNPATSTAQASQTSPKNQRQARSRSRSKGKGVEEQVKEDKGKEDKEDPCTPKDTAPQPPSLPLPGRVLPAGRLNPELSRGAHKRKKPLVGPHLQSPVPPGRLPSSSSSAKAAPALSGPQDSPAKAPGGGWASLPEPRPPGRIRK